MPRYVLDTLMTRERRSARSLLEQTAAAWATTASPTLN